MTRDDQNFKDINGITITAGDKIYNKYNHPSVLDVWVNIKDGLLYAGEYILDYKFNTKEYWKIL